MPHQASKAYDPTSPLSIFEYSEQLIGHSLHSLLGDGVIERLRQGKGALGQMVEELFFGYSINSEQEADFADAKVELKCTPLLKNTKGGYRIKERLVCSMIDYFKIAETDFEDSAIAIKCQLMLLLFYLHVYGAKSYDYEFLYRVLWEFPEKDLQLIKKDYQTIADKVRRGEAHLLSEGDTLYLGACRKGSKGDSPQEQPYSTERAPKRAFSLKPAYMRYILGLVANTPNGAYSNHTPVHGQDIELVTSKELQRASFETIILERFKPFIGKTYTGICQMLGIEPYRSKSKYADIAALIASNLKCKRLEKSEEFIKSGIIVKTIRLRANGMPKESMSFKNIDYREVMQNDDWLKSEAYELFTSRFMFVVFKPLEGQTITVINEEDGTTVTEQAYALDSVFFWTMPPDDLAIAQTYWQNIRDAVMANNINAQAFWSIGDRKKFHVRPKAHTKADKAENPHGGACDKFSYWFNAEYVHEIIESENND